MRVCESKKKTTNFEIEKIYSIHLTCSLPTYLLLLLCGVINIFQTIGFFGAIAGAASVYGNTPIDVVKTRMQGLEASKYKNTVDCFKQIWKHEGFFALVFYLTPHIP